jgi:UDP-N-acetylglucosamine 2-epimerase (non-hydrolysing)
LQILDKFPDTALLLPLHRNSYSAREPLQALLGNHPRVFLTEPLDYAVLVWAIGRSHLLLTDSGLQEEAPSLGKPVLVLRETTERPEAVAAGTAKLVELIRRKLLLLQLIY